MLEFREIVPHVGELAAETGRRKEVRERQLAVALRQARLCVDDWASQRERISTAKTRWLKAIPTIQGDPPSLSTAAPAAPERYTAIACDGSQIPFDRHEIALCYVLNVGRVMLCYGTGERPLLASSASVHYRDEDVLAADRGPDEQGDTAYYVDERELATRRFLAEMTALGALIESCRDRTDVVAFIDGTLVLWNQESAPDETRRKVLGTYLEVMERAKAARIPVAGYISRPGSREQIGSLRVTVCPAEGPVVCSRCPYTAINPLPCSSIDQLTDADLFAPLLEIGSRSDIYASESRVLNAYRPDDQRISFFYMNAGSEIARIEIPLWVAQDADLLQRCHAIAYDQCRKGAGYPVCMAEAHEQAIIRSPERAAFFRMVERALVQAKIPVTRTAKAVAKGRRRV